ncbi:MAG TPA: hypothetical protein PJ982_17920, partial [Lacipirellulaceae bacterium]|nr:hypothetical protein [Lacipirellulaceae bacterium]
MSTATTNGVAAPPKPARMEVDPENIPGELLELPRWLVWRFTFDPRGDGGRGKWTKTPICARTGRAGSSTDSAA